MHSRARLLQRSILTSAGLWLLVSAPVFAATICCKCHVVSDPKTTLCLTSQQTASCTTIISKSNNATNLQGVTCDASPTLDPAKDCQVAAANGPGVCTQAPLDAATYTTIAGSSAVITPPVLNVPIPGVSFTQNISAKEKTITLPFLAQYLAGIYRYLISISVIAAAVMVVYGGFKYILGSSITSITSGKETIVNAIIGLVLVFATYTILNVVSPPTTQLNGITIPVIQPSVFTVPEGTYQTLQQTAAVQGFKPDPTIAAAVKAATGGTQPASRQFPNNPFDSRTTLPADQLDNILTTIAQKNGLDVCILKAIVATESGRRMNAIGHDEETNYVAVQARLDFLRSGITYTGKAFTVSPPLPANCDSSCQSILNANAGIHNDDALNSTAPDYGLDWRFSHGLGVSQCTIFPKGKGPGQCTGPSGELGTSVGGTCYTVPILLTWEGNLGCMAGKIKALASLQDPCKIFVGYSGDKTDPTCTGQLLSKKMAAYNSCKGGG